MKKFKRQQNLKPIPKQQVQAQQSAQSAIKSPPKSFRSKLFQKRAIKPIPKINSKQIFLHSPLYQKYLQAQFKLPQDQKAPQIWGCLIPAPRKIQSVRQNYLKRNINTPQNLFRSYVKRKNRLIYGIPITKQFDQFNRKAQNPQNSNKDESQNMDKFFEKMTHFNHTMRQKVKKYEEQQMEDTHSKFFLTKPQDPPKTERYSSQFGKRIAKNKQLNLSQDINNLKNKSMYKMSLQELKHSVEWKKNFLKILDQSIKQAQAKYF